MTRKKKRNISKRVLHEPERSYQPSVAEQKKEYDMPEASLRKIKKAFFRPFEFQKVPKNNKA